MATPFTIEILTPARKVLSTEVTEVVLPAYDGERGILGDHEDFIGMLGTGAIKIVENSDDYWFLVSSGVFEISKGKLTLFAELAETAEEIDADAAKAEVESLEQKFNDHANFNPDDYPAQKVSFDLNSARVEVHRRTELVN